MTKVYESELVTGVINTEVYGAGITSTEAEPKTLAAVILAISARQGNFARLWYEREKRANIQDSLLPLPADFFRVRLEMNLEIPVGRTVKPSILSGGVANNLTVLYEYEVK